MLLLSFNNTKVRHFLLPGKLSKLYFSCHKVKYMLGEKKIIPSFIIINQSIRSPTAKGFERIPNPKRHVNEIIIRPFKSEIFKGNSFIMKLGIFTGKIKKGKKRM